MLLQGHFCPRHVPAVLCCFQELVLAFGMLRLTTCSQHSTCTCVLYTYQEAVPLASCTDGTPTNVCKQFSYMLGRNASLTVMHNNYL